MSSKVGIKYLCIVSFFIFRERVEIYLPDTVGIKVDCNFDSIQQKHLKKRRSSFFLKISLPLVRKGYLYIFKHNQKIESNTKSENVSQKLFWFLKQRLKESGISSEVQFSNFLNSMENLEIPRNGHGQLNYVKNTLSKGLGDRIFGVDPALEDEKTVDIVLNDFFPSVEYDKKDITGLHDDRSKAYEDKNIPLRVTIFPLSRECSGASKNVKDLIILMKLAMSGLMKKKDDSSWRNFSKVCQNI